MSRQFIFLLFLLVQTAVINGQEEYIAISKRGPVSALPGDLISYTITVGNGDQSDWTGTITDVLPDEFTFISSDPAATTVAGQTLTWSGFTVLSGQNREITITGYTGRLGSEFGLPRYPDGYYMVNSNVPSTITNNLQLANGTSGGSLVDSYTTNVFQRVDFFLLNATGVIKMSTGATTRYLVIVQNLGNVWDRYTIYTDPLNQEYGDCVNPPIMIPTGENVDLYNAVLDMDDNPLSTTPWIAPGETYSFYLELTTPNGTPANRWNCTDVEVISEVSGLMKTETFHTATIQPPSDPVLSLYNIDYPDPVACEDTLNYTIYIINQGTDAYNTTISNIYDPYFEFISSDPAPDGGTNNTWTLGILPENDFTRVDIQGRILPGVVDQQAIEDSVIVSYDDGSLPSTPFIDTAVTYTTVNAYPDLEIEKLASGTLVRLGDTITYTINYSNMGCGTGTGITIADDFDELRTSIVDDGGGTVSGGVLTFDIGTLSPADGMQTLEYSLAVTDVDCGAAQIENEVIITSDQPDADVLNNSAFTPVLAVSVPSWVSFPADITVECDNVPDPAVIGQLEDIWAEDACGRNVTIIYEGEILTPGDCDNSYTLTRTWRAEDDYGNFTERSQQITVIDTTAPVIACPSFAGYNTSTDGTGHVTVTLEANSGNNYLVSNDDFNTTATDNCDGAPLITFILTGSTTGTGQDLNGVTLNSGTTEVSWFAADQCGNESTCVYTLLVNADPVIVLTKSLDSINGDPGIDSYVNVGDELKYGFTIANAGNVTLYNITVSDPMANVAGTTIPELAPAAVNNTSFTGSYVVSQADIDRGYFTNIASVSGTAINAAVASDRDTVTVAAIQSPAIVLTKSLDNINGDPGTDTIVNDGDELQYGFTITNTGNVTLYNVTVSDPLANVAGATIPELAPAGVDNTSFSGSYVVSQADIDLGYFTNIALVAGTAPDAAVISDTDTVTVAAIQSPSIVLTKSLDNINGDTGTDSFVNDGDELQYGFTITNTGNVTLYNITVSDPLASVAGTTIPELAPAGVDNTSFTGSYVVSQADVDMGYFTNIASVSGTAPDAAVASDIDTVTVAAIQSPAIVLTKSLNSINGDPGTDSFANAGDELQYGFTITNTGNVTLYNVTVSDPLASVAGTTIPELAPAGVDNTSFTGSYVVSQADIDMGYFTNIASVSGTSPDAAVASDIDTVTVAAIQSPAIVLTKSLNNINGDPGSDSFVNDGDELQYGFTITNTGNVTLYNITVSDPLASVAGTTIPELAPAGVDNTSFTGSYVVSQADVDMGYFTNIASVSGTAPDAAVASDIDTVTVAAIQSPAFEFTKTSTTDPNTFTEIGDELTYELLLRNSGNLTLNDITVVDSLTGDNWLLDVLSPGESEIFTTSYFVVQADLDAGRVVNTASAIVPGLDTLGVATDDVDEEIINANQLFTLEVTKTIDQVDYVYAGDDITYQIILENTGNVNLLNISVRDTLPESTIFVQADNGGSYDQTDHTVSWTITQLSPGQVLTYEIQVSVDNQVANATLISNLAVTESVQTYLVESNQVQVTALQLPEVQLVSVSHVGCYGEKTGMISVEVVGGLAPYTVIWSHDASQSGFEVSDLTPGTYTVSIEDALGNTDDLTVTIEEPDAPLSGVSDGVDILCAGESTGSIDIEITGGTAPYAYLWSNSSTSQDLEGVPAGSYSVLVTDANGCTWSDTTTLAEPAEVMAISNEVVVDVVCQNDPTGSISFEIGGGVLPYNYSWNNDATTQTLARQTGGDYTVTVTDANGCQLVSNFSIGFQLDDCDIEPPGGLTPYGEFDQTWIIRGLDQYENNSVKIFNRYGTMVYQANPYQNDWTGEPNLNRSLAESDGKLASGTYYYILLLEPGSEPLSGYIYLMKE